MGIELQPPAAGDGSDEASVVGGDWGVAGGRLKRLPLGGQTLDI